MFKNDIGSFLQPETVQWSTDTFVEKIKYARDYAWHTQMHVVVQGQIFHVYWRDTFYVVADHFKATYFEGDFKIDGRRVSKDLFYQKIRQLIDSRRLVAQIKEAFNSKQHINFEVQGFEFNVYWLENKFHVWTDDFHGTYSLPQGFVIDCPISESAFYLRIEQLIKVKRSW